MAGPPFESSTPIVIACGVATAISVFVWTHVQTRPWLIAAVLACVAGGATFLADRLVITDREFLLRIARSMALVLGFDGVAERDHLRVGEVVQG